MDRPASARTAVMLAAGIGKRLQPVTRDVPKPLLDINGITIIARTMNGLATSGIDSFVIVVNPAFEDMFRASLDGMGFDITYVHQAMPSGMSDAITRACPLVNGSFVVCAGDMLVPADHARDLLNIHDAVSPLATLSLIEVPVAHVPGMGNVKMEGGRVVRIIEKPSPEEVLSNLYSVPFYSFTPDIFEYLDRCPVSKRGERELQDAIQIAINEGRLVTGVVMDRRFPAGPEAFKREVAPLNITDATDYLSASLAALKGTGISKPDDVLCTMIEPVSVGKDCTISDDCLLGPNAIIGNDVTLDALVEVSNAVVQDGCKIGMKAFIEHAIIMKGAVVPDNAVIRGQPSTVKVVE